MTSINNAKILTIATHGFEQVELEVSRDKLREAGAKIDVATPGGKEIRGWDRKDWGRNASANLKIADAKESNYNALVIPGGVLNPDKLRIDEEAMKLVRALLNSGKIVTAVCHGPWLLVQADALRGRNATSHKSIRKDLENAVAKWEDGEVVTDNGIITSRNPDNPPAFTKKIIEEIEEGRATSARPRRNKPHASAFARTGRISKSARRAPRVFHQ